MKKILKVLVCLCFAACLFVGCSKSHDTKYLQLKQDTGNVNIVIDMELIHDDDKVYNQNQETVVQLADETTYKTMLQYLKDTGLDAEAKKYDGAEYEIIEDEANFKITEVVKLDLTKLSADGYSAMTMGTVNPDENYYVGYEETVNNLKTQGFTVVEK